MYNYEKTGLLIFDNFQVDFNLEKWQKRRYDPSQPGRQVPEIFPRINRSNGATVFSGNAFIPINPQSGITTREKPVGAQAEKESGPSLFDKIFNRKKIKKRKQEREMALKQANFFVETTPEDFHPEIPVEEFFKSVKNSAQELVLASDRFKNYQKSIEHLKRTGQVALLEHMESQLEIHRAETQCYAIGLRKVITEENLLSFATKSDRALKLDWVQNFTRSIPEKAVEVKMKADQNLIFDNYVVLHYDPDGNGSEKTEAEKIKEKDPILFGVIAGSTKLYYIACWVDEYCDLTFEKMVEVLGEKAVNANDISVEIQVTE